MSHQDRMSHIVINHQTIKQVVDWLLPPALFVGMKVRQGATWLPRMLAVTALIWATLRLENLTACFEQARKITKKIFRWQPEPGITYQGFMKVFGKWHVGTGLPWDWWTGPSDSSEREHLEEMLGKLPKNSLITADAGFVGYDFWTAILKAKHHFVIRVGGECASAEEAGICSRIQSHRLPLAGPSRQERAAAVGVAIDRDT